MELSVHLVALAEIVRWRDFYREEMHCQIIHDSIHSRPGWSLEYRLSLGANRVGYGSVAIAGPWKEYATIYEYYVIPQFRNRIFDLFSALITGSRARKIETQSNDSLLTAMLHTFGKDVQAESILYHDGMLTNLKPNGASFRFATAAEEPELSPTELESHGVVEFEGRVAGKGGILFHYNRPYGDIFMEVGAPFRNRGIGAYLVQELKRLCYQGGSIPSARCNLANVPSRKTLQKAGFVPCGHIITANIPQ
jgi:GNAT superfamily N-acetyltransferase